MSTMVHHDVQADSDLVLLVALTGSKSTSVTRRFAQVDSSESVEPAGQLETQVGPSHSLESVVMMSPIQTRGTQRESPFAINGDYPGHTSLDDSNLPPRLGTSSIRAPTSPQTALSPTSNTLKIKGTVCVFSESERDLDESRSCISPTRSASPVPTVKRVMIHREKTGTDWQSVFNVVKYGEEKRAAMVMREMGAETDDMMGPSP
ncbi:uncharacterized protein EDB93DRAFT_1105811 [Suillus bovinus]|uniref:uncharacterized protein n=1 Tax=Suillus bovinus TaxID=48563 RepID=UPI001B86497C|nr:uncharacterized protein EDB93DRAFT_1105811 [Suillus bovinus]KAG2140890.1 hypothetical protein EDB93DRAFT_1105811 [Suillus bovinus]